MDEALNTDKKKRKFLQLVWLKQNLNDSSVRIGNPSPLQENNPKAQTIFIIAAEKDIIKVKHAKELEAWFWFTCRMAIKDGTVQSADTGCRRGSTGLPCLQRKCTIENNNQGYYYYYVTCNLIHSIVGFNVQPSTKPVKRNVIHNSRLQIMMHFNIKKSS